MRQAIFGATEGCDIYTCDSVQLHTWSYEVVRAPAGIRIIGESRQTITRDQMDELLKQACNNPGTP